MGRLTEFYDCINKGIDPDSAYLWLDLDNETKSGKMARTAIAEARRRLKKQNNEPVMFLLTPTSVSWLS